MRAFSTIEILLAIAILTITVTAVAVVGLGTPFMLANMKLEFAALMSEDAELTRVEHMAWTEFDHIHSVASTTYDDFERSLTIHPIQEGSVHAYANASWSDSLGALRSSMLETRLTNVLGDNSCDSFVSGDWSTPNTHQYELARGDLLPTTMPTDSYPIKDLHVTAQILIATVRATAQVSSPTLFFFDISSSTQRPVLIGTGFDNASTSRIGFSETTTGDRFAYAANGFGSMSAATCAGNYSCAQIQIFSLPGDELPKLVSGISLATTSPPFAFTAEGTTAPATAITYSNELLYVGLQKTASGDEFNIVDVHDPLHPRWVSGMPIGRSINKILVHEGFAYVGTDDSTRELIVFDVHDPEHPTLAGYWNAPGSTGFGFGTALTMSGATLMFGRSYVSNAPELVAVDTHDLSNIHEVESRDIGTLLDPLSIRGLISQDFLTFALTPKKLQFWNLSDKGTFLEFAPAIPFPSGTTGTSLACHEDTLYIGLENTRHASGAIEIIKNI